MSDQLARSHNASTVFASAPRRCRLSALGGIIQVAITQEAWLRTHDSIKEWMTWQQRPRAPLPSGLPGFQPFAIVSGTPTTTHPTLRWLPPRDSSAAPSTTRQHAAQAARRMDLFRTSSSPRARAWLVGRPNSPLFEWDAELVRTAVQHRLHGPGHTMPRLGQVLDRLCDRAAVCPCAGDQNRRHRAVAHVFLPRSRPGSRPPSSEGESWSAPTPPRLRRTSTAGRRLDRPADFWILRGIDVALKLGISRSLPVQNVSVKSDSGANVPQHGQPMSPDHPSHSTFRRTRWVGRLRTQLCHLDLPTSQYHRTPSDINFELAPRISSSLHRDPRAYHFATCPYGIHQRRPRPTVPGIRRLVAGLG